MTLIVSNAHYCEKGVAYLGTLLSGAAAVPLGAAQSRRERERTISAVEPELVIVCDASSEPGLRVRTASLESLEADAVAPLQTPTLTPQEPAEYLSTSGTSGRPRLVEVPHGSIAWDADTEPAFDPAPK